MRTGARIGAVLAFTVLLAQPSHSEDLLARSSHRPIFLISKALDTFGRDISGDEQLGTVMAMLPRPIVVSVNSVDGTPAPGVTVTFRVVAEPDGNYRSGFRAEMITPSVTTDEHGYAKAKVKLGSEPGAYKVSAAVEGEDVCLTFVLRGMHRGWGAFLFFSLIGGLALFLFGLDYVGRALNRGAGGKLRHFIFSLSEKKHVGIMVGALLTLLVQSSSATVTMLISFANTGLLSLSQSMGLILGADIGTTVTVQVIAFKVTNLAPVLVGLGFALMAFRQRHARYAGRVIFGVGIVFLGLRLMSDAVSPLQASPVFRELVSVLATRPLLTLVFAALFAALVRSSAGPIGVAIMLGYGNMIDIEGAIAVVLGANMGSALVALLASAGSTTAGKRVAVAHALFKFTVVLVFFLLLKQFTLLVSAIGGPDARQIANAHTILNIAAVVLFFPFISPFERLVRAIAREGPDAVGRRPKYLDETVLNTPSLAIGQAQRETTRLADMVSEMFTKVRDVLRSNDDKLRREIVAADDKVDELSERITNYLTRISEEELSVDQSSRGIALLHIVDELESIGDVVSKSLMVYAKKKIETGFYFSKEGFAEINEFHEFVCDTVRMAFTAFSAWDIHLAGETVGRRVEGARRLTRLQEAHIERLRKEKPESLDTSSVHLDLIRDLERVNFHACNTAEVILGRMSDSASILSQAH